MNLQLIGRFVAMLTGAAVLFALIRVYDINLYIGIVIGIVAYTAVRAVFALLATSDADAK